MVRDKNQAEDITAAAFQIGWEKRAQFRGESSLSTWLTAMAHNRPGGTGVAISGPGSNQAQRAPASSSSGSNTIRRTRPAAAL